ncbi:MAG: VOC family protein [Bacteroidota bacterium]
MIKTYGLTHIALAVKNVERSAKFYCSVFGAKITYRSKEFIQIETPKRKDVIVFEQLSKKSGKRGGILHFGFRLVHPRDITKAIVAVKKAGGKILQHGEFVPGEPYLFFTDPDGYEVEVWFEKKR